MIAPLRLLLLASLVLPLAAADFRMDRNGVPDWPADAKHPKDVFTFVRIRYDSWSGRGGDWRTDYPDADLNFSWRLQQITSLINDLLDIGSIEAGFDTRREFVQLEGILRYTLDMLQGQIKSKQLTVKTDIEPFLPALRANPIRLRRVMDNVVGNAIKYSYPNGEIHISIHAEGEQLILKVTDAGPGIPVADQPDELRP